MNQFFQKYKLSQLIQYEINNLNSLVTIKEIEFLIIKLPKRNLQNGFTGNFQQMVKKELSTILHNLLQKIKEKGILLNIFF